MDSEDSKPIKKVKAEEGGGAEDRKISGSKNPSKLPNANAKTRPKDAKVKKEEPQDEGFLKPRKNPTISASRSIESRVKKEENNEHKTLANADKCVKEVKRKKVKEGLRKGRPSAEQKKREKKVYDLPGQKRDPPEERDPLRIFYETLYHQVPHSEMAQIWMMESGLLPVEEAKKIFGEKQKKSQQLKVTFPVKAASAVKKKTSSSPVSSVKKKPSDSSTKKKNTDSSAALKQSKKRKAEDNDDDFVLSDRKHKKKKAA